MFKTKRDVDRHVTHILNRIRDEKERNSRGYQFAKLYYDIADYESSKRYLQAFLSVRETVPQAHKLMGQIYEGLRDKAKAIESYKRCLDLDPEQKEVVLKVCELYTDASVKVNSEIAKIWIEKAEEFYPGDHTVFKLKERLLEKKDGATDYGEMEHLISTELSKNPDDVQLHVKLLLVFIQSRQVEKAFEHAVKTEKTLTFLASIEWYECLLNVFQVYQDQLGSTDNTLFFMHKLFALSSLTLLRLKSEDRDFVATIKTLKQLDEDLFVANNLPIQGPEWENFLTEMKGQLFYLVALLLLKRAKKGQVPWRDASLFSCVCFLISDSLPSLGLKSTWFVKSTADWKKFYEQIYMTGCDRLSQGGHMLTALLNKQEGIQAARKLQHKLCTPQGKTALFTMVFTGTDAARRNNISYFLSSDIYTTTDLRAPDKTEREKYDAVAWSFHRGDLNYLVWLGLRYYNPRDGTQPDYEQLFGSVLFPDMKYSVPDLNGGSPSTLCQLDIQSFLYVTIYWAMIHLKERKRTMHVIADKPDLLPVCIGPSICNKQQAEWWTAMYKMEKGSPREKQAKIWGTVMRGLETIRLVIPNALSLQLVVHVAKTLDTRAREMESIDTDSSLVSPKLSGVQNRAEFYWSIAAEIIDRMDRSQTMKTPKDLLFPMDAVTDPAVKKDMRDQVKFAMAMLAMKQDNYETALTSFSTLYKSEASFYTGLIYKRLSQCENTNMNSSASADCDQQIRMLTKSKESLYQALDRLEVDKNEQLKREVKEELDDVLQKLIYLESGGPLSDTMLSTQSQYGSDDDDDDDETSEPVKPSTSMNRSGARTPSKTSVSMVSPTRLDVQLRALETTNAALSARMTSLEETVKMSNNLTNEILIQLRQSRDEVKGLKDHLQILCLQPLSNMSMIRPSTPATPQHTPRMNMQPFGGGPPLYDFVGQNGLPPHMSQYGLASSSSPRPGSAYGQPTYDESFHIDGEIYDPEVDPEFNIPDQNLIQEWPFGHKPGLEGKSTITYTPQQQMHGLNPQNAGMFANALRGHSIQYGAGCPPMPPAAPQQVPAQLPGPGFFSQNNTQIHGASLSTQAAMIPGAPGSLTRPGIPPTAASVQPTNLNSKPTSTIQTSTPKHAAPMMPPNAVIPTQSSETRPKLIPGSVGVPASTMSVTVSKSAIPSSTTSSPIPPSSVPQPGPASSLLSNLASKHVEDSAKAASSTSPATASGQKTVVKGFTFSSTPIISQLKEEPKKEEKTPTATTIAAAKPFGGFSFTPTKPSTPGTSTTFSTQGSTSASMPFGSSTGAPSFAALASSPAFHAAGDQKGFAGTGMPLFGKSPSPRRRNTSACSDDHVEEYEPNVDFKPVIQLPELVEVKTGEEEEEKLFCERAKLFRFDNDANQWKERGLGEMKILRHRESGRVRILMRREQVLKLCANHTITTEMKLTPMQSSDKAWVWYAMDFADGEMKAEQLAVKFKTPDIADRFKKVFEGAQADMYPNNKEGAGEKEKAMEKKTEQTKPKSGPLDSDKCSLAEMFKPKAGSWTCNGCFVNNAGEVLRCPCCQTLKPGVKPEDIKSDSSASGGFGFGGLSSGGSVASTTGGGFSFGGQGSSKPSSGTVTFGGPGVGSANTASKPATTTSSGGFMFGAPSAASSTVTTTSSGFAFGSTAGSSNSGFKFGESTVTTASATLSVTSTTASIVGIFGAPTKTLFGSPATASTPGTLFGSPASSATSQPSKPLFESPATTSSTIFGSPATSSTAQTGKPLFGSPATSGVLFGLPATSATSQPNKPLFGSPTTTSTSGSIFGSPATSATSQPGKPLFGSPATFPVTTTASTGFAFGQTSSTTHFGSAASSSGGSSLFGNAATSGGIFGTKPESDATKPSTGVFSFGNSASTAATTTAAEAIKPVSAGVQEVSQAHKKPSESLLVRYLSSPDSWKCTQCSISNDGLNDQCKKCGADQSTSAAKKSDDTSVQKTSAAKTSHSSFKFGETTGMKQDSSAGFDFSTAAPKSNEGFKFTLAPASDSPQKQPAASLGSGFNFSMSMTPMKSPGKSPGKSGLMSPKSPEINEEGYYVNKEGDDSHIHFEPVISLPERVEVKTGEEDEDVIFTHRAKLYRFVNGEWKERGLGDVKVLYNQTANKARIIMRREQILKLCCHHYITSELKLTPMPNSKGCALVWFAMDFAEDEPKPEQFSIKFKNEDVAKSFESAVDDAKGMLNGEKPKTDSRSSVPTVVETVRAQDTPATTKDVDATKDGDVEIGKIEQATPEEIAKARQLKLPDHFYMYLRKPPCRGCIGCKDEVPEVGRTTSQESEEYEDTEDDDDDYDDDDDDDDDYEDETEEEVDDETLEEEIRSGALLFGGVEDSGMFSFASLAQSTDTKAFSTDASKPFSWQGAGKQLFGGGGGAAAGGGSDDDDEVGQGEDRHFEPVVPLPDLVEVKTGEEDDTVEFAQRSKLYRFDNGAWKEKGIGEIKILKNKVTGKYRLLMRREQVLKLACNHWLTPDLRFQEMDTSETTWCWSAQDYADGEAIMENFAIKFKNIELARIFKDKIDEVQGLLKG